MSYIDVALKNLEAKLTEAREQAKGEAEITMIANLIHDYKERYEEGVALIKNSKELIRVITEDEYNRWNSISKCDEGGINPKDIYRLFGEDVMYDAKWFTLDRPYVFSKQKVNEPNDRDRHLMIVIEFTPELKSTVIKKLLPDLNMKLIDAALKKDSCRCKHESGVVTIGISHGVLEQTARNIKITKLGAHLVPTGVKQQ